MDGGDGRRVSGGIRWEGGKEHLGQLEEQPPQTKEVNGKCSKIV